MEDLEQRTISANGLTFGYLAAGSATAPLALCLHGFPDTAFTYRHLLPALADAGYRAVAPFMRGYAPTEVAPDGRYSVAALAEDANALHEALGGDGRAVLVGHDWGAAAAYPAAFSQPDRWSRVVTLAVPPPGALAGAFLSYDQLRKSWYMFFFQHPLSDIAVPMNDLQFVARLWEDWSPGYDAADDMARVRESIGATENLSAALGYYRAMFGSTPEPAPTGDLAQPLLYLHGSTDGCMGADLAAQVPQSRIVEGAGHFLHLEKPDEVNRIIVEFLAG
jgi:pimeloyl-ACP methyl ester carboxylesterase